jgi:hypothetical protein
MRSTFPIVAALMLAFASNQAAAQSQADQAACEGDVFNLCADKIPDENAIVVCLRKQWSKVSKECRQVMISYKKKQGNAKRKGANEAISNGFTD